MAYKNPLAVRSQQVKANINSYQKAAIERTADKFSTDPSKIAFMWMFDPEGEMTRRTRNYYFSIVDSIGEEDIYQCA